MVFIVPDPIENVFNMVDQGHHPGRRAFSLSLFILNDNIISVGRTVFSAQVVTMGMGSAERV